MSNFNPTDEQKAIIEPEQFSSAMIIANAGSGKTNTLVRRAIKPNKFQVGKILPLSALPIKVLMMF